MSPSIPSLQGSGDSEEKEAERFLRVRRDGGYQENWPSEHSRMDRQMNSRRR